MTGSLGRIRGGRFGLIGLVLLILLVLVVAHALVMGGGHDEDMACGSCVVVVATGLAAVVALRQYQIPVATSAPRRRWDLVPAASSYPFRPSPLRSVVLRL